MMTTDTHIIGRACHLLRKYFPFALVILIQLSCKKYIQIPPPTGELVTQTVFENSSTATAAQTVIYSQMAINGESYNLALNTGLLSDELTNWSTVPNIIQFYTNSLKAINNPGPWPANAYNYIYQANAVIAGVNNNTLLPPSVINQLVGESKFLRAFWLFYLTNLYDGVPIPTSPSYTINATLARSSSDSVYAQIVSDLKDAENLLNPNFIDASDTTMTTERTRPNAWAAHALMARVYLYQGDYADALSEANLVIGNTTLFSLCPNLNSVFLMNSSEAIWQLQVPLPSTINTPDGANFILQGTPESGANNNATISPQLESSFEPNDLRQTNWIHDTAIGGTNYYYPFKYKVFSGSQVSEYTMVLRLGEQFLIRAEANAELGNTAPALSDLNAIRTRAGLLSYAGGTDQASILTAILHERQVELFTEWGNRWFDLRRSGTINAIMGGPNGVCAAKGGIWNTDWQWYPVPQSERTSDPNLTQNDGY
jgi:starch-binding outer membrane protein, SusD/RagB family